MLRFYCDFRRNGTYITDTEGAYWESSEDAYLDAYSSAQEIMGEILAEGTHPKNCAFEIRDERGILFVLNFAEVVKTDRLPHPPLMTTVHAHVERTKQVVSDFRSELQRVRDALAEARELIAAEI